MDGNVELLKHIYNRFNARDIDAALRLMTPDVAWPRAFKGGFVRGPDEVRAYWTEQWSEIDPTVAPLAFHPEEAGRIFALARPRLAVYSHIVPSMATAADLVPPTRKEYKGRLAVGYDLMTITIGEKIVLGRRSIAAR